MTFNIIPSAAHTLEGSMYHWYEEKNSQEKTIILNNTNNLI